MIRTHPYDKLKIFTWHIHGSYLYYLSQGDYNIYIPVKKQRSEGYYGRGKTFPFGENVIELAADDVKNMKFDCILFQSNKNYLHDQYEILTDEQRNLPQIYVEHDPPWADPADTKHVVTNPEIIMVHVTHYNKLMWQNSSRYVKVIEHGVMPSENLYTGELSRGIVVINHLHQRGRKAGADIFEEVCSEIPLDLTGMGTREFGGLGEVLHPKLPAFISRYRFFFNPIRYTSLGLAVCEAMMIGMPVVAFATTEYVTVIENGVSGFIHTDVRYLIEKMKLLLYDHQLARAMSEKAKQIAEQRFNINRFVKDWKETFQWAINVKAKKYEEQNSIH
jgi:hypothetical protein